MQAFVPRGVARVGQAAAVVAELYRTSGGMPPTVRQVTEAMGLRSSASTMDYLKRAVAAGLLRHGSSGLRTCYVPAAGPYCPLCGHWVGLPAERTTA